jgi:hypothetical protein
MNGGRTFVDNTPSRDLKDNWRVGDIFSIPIAPKHSIKLKFYLGAFTNTGYNYKLAAISYQYIFFKSLDSIIVDMKKIHNHNLLHANLNSIDI